MPKADRGQYDLAQRMLWYIRYLQKELERRELLPDDPACVSLRKERLRLVKVHADREEYELKQKRAQLVPPEVIDEFQRCRSAAITSRAGAVSFSKQITVLCLLHWLSLIKILQTLNQL